MNDLQTSVRRWHFIWEDADDEYATVVNAWWASGCKTRLKTSTAIAAGS